MVLSLLIISVALGLQYYFSQSIAKDAADKLFSRTASNISIQLHGLDDKNSSLVRLFSQFPNLAQAKDTGSHQIHPIVYMMAQAMELDPHLYASYIGYRNGDFYELVNLTNREYKASKIEINDRWAIVQVHDTAEGRRRISRFYDKDFNLTHQISEPSQYYANIRPWYIQAVEATPNSVIKTSPYLFHTSQTSGITYAQQIGDTGSVVAVNMSLAMQSDFLRESHPYSRGESMIYDIKGKVIAHSKSTEPMRDLEVETLSLSDSDRKYLKSLGRVVVANEKNWPPYDFSYGGIPQGYSIDLIRLLAKKLGMQIEFSNGYDWHELLHLFRSQRIDLMHMIVKASWREPWGRFTDPYLTLTPALVTQADARQVTSLAQLDGEVLALPKDWMPGHYIRERFPQIRILEVNDTQEALSAVVAGRAFATIATEHTFAHLIEIFSLEGLKLQNLEQSFMPTGSSEMRMLVSNNEPRLQALLNRALAALTPDELEHLRDKWLTPKPADDHFQPFYTGVVPNGSFLKLADELAQGRAESAVDQIKIDHKSYTVFVHQIESSLGADTYLGIILPTAEIDMPYMSKIYLAMLLSLAVLLLMIPVLSYFSGRLVGSVKLLADENLKIKAQLFSVVEHVPSHIKEIDDLSSSIVSMSSSIASHQRSQQELLDAFIRLIAQAIDDKSPYTGSHCERMPELAMMLAEAVDKDQCGVYRNFKFTDDAQWRQFQIAAWLHDCGKVTTPEHVIDKGTKLEVIYNRIHEVRMRFEVLLRDAEIEYWQQVDKGEDRQLAGMRLIQKQQQIKDDFAFIAECNVGTESLDVGKQQRILDIATQTWVRHLNDRLGLSPREKKFMAQFPPQALPVTEPLLADRPEHQQPWLNDPKERLDKSFKMLVPELSSNDGEIYNLSISQGTLTEEDRYRINEHIISTILMLEALPLPEELARVPEIAGGHHETLIGTGYPKQLQGDELSVEARILAIADVFEALTASDRPYKEPKTLTQALDILAGMVERQKLDADLFRLFLQSGVYMQYARRYLTDEQCDEVDIQKYFS